MRLFIAIPIPEPVRAEMIKLQDELRAAAPGPGIRWVKAGQFHLTLKFLGEVEAGRAEALEAAIRAACAGCSAFKMWAGQAGYFPNEHRPRVLWIGLHCENGQLDSLQRAIEAATLDFAEEREKGRFAAHLTLARIKFLRPTEARALAEKVQLASSRRLGEWTAHAVELIQSELHPEGSRYTSLARVPLA
jgi:RNA 2',3'-cyclic 3'-phosphodiesterase